MTTETSIQQRYEAALDALVIKLKQDPYVLAAIIHGSLSYDVVWERSDIDLLVITQEVKSSRSSLTLVEDGIITHAILQRRSEFKKWFEGSLQSSFSHSFLVHGKILFTRDESIAEMFAQRPSIGAHDRETQLLNASIEVLMSFTKAQKFFRVKHDLHYSFLWILRCVDGLARVETILNGEVPRREVIHQALRHNPEFFQAVYTHLIDGDKTTATIANALERIHRYLLDHVPVLFKPILDYLAEAEGARSTTEITHYFANQRNVGCADAACEWLADEEILRKVSTPVRLTEKSRIDFQEAAYYAGGE